MNRWNLQLRACVSTKSFAISVGKTVKWFQFASRRDAQTDTAKVVFFDGPLMSGVHRFAVQPTRVLGTDATRDHALRRKASKQLELTAARGQRGGRAGLLGGEQDGRRGGEGGRR